MWKLLLFIQLLFVASQSSLRCPEDNAEPLKFLLVRQCQRAATDEALALESTSSLEDCITLAHQLRGLALNYAPGGKRGRSNLYAPEPKNDDGKGTANRRFKDARRLMSVFEQPGEFFNCHVLQCPQNSSFGGMVNDSRFDYYSLYGRPTTVQNISCVPQLGLFVFHAQPSSYLNATQICGNSTEFIGNLAHIASEARTYALTDWLRDYNRARASFQPEPAILLAYVGLQYNRSNALQSLDFRNAQQQSLLCFLYRAWHVGHPRLGVSYTNVSCVALTPRGTWQTLSCDLELPFICEILRPSSGSGPFEQLETGKNSADECQQFT